MVDKSRIEGVAQQVKGSIKEAIGKLTGDRKMQADGAAEQVAGKGRKTAGAAKDAVRDATEK